jgi:hypothetical protein
MQVAKVALIVIEPYRERSNPDFVAEKTGARVLTLPAIPTGDAPDYVAFLEADVQTLAQALRPGGVTP